MSTRNLIDAIGNIDDKYIEEYHMYKSKPVIVRIIPYIAATACAAAALAIGLKFGGNSPVIPEDNNTTVISKMTQRPSETPIHSEIAYVDTPTPSEPLSTDSNNNDNNSTNSDTYLSQNKHNRNYITGDNSDLLKHSSDMIFNEINADNQLTNNTQYTALLQTNPPNGFIYDPDKKYAIDNPDNGYINNYPLPGASYTPDNRPSRTPSHNNDGDTDPTAAPTNAPVIPTAKPSDEPVITKTPEITVEPTHAPSTIIAWNDGNVIGSLYYINNPTGPDDNVTPAPSYTNAPVYTNTPSYTGSPSYTDEPIYTTSAPKPTYFPSAEKPQPSCSPDAPTNIPLPEGAIMDKIKYTNIPSIQQGETAYITVVQKTNVTADNLADANTDLQNIFNSSLQYSYINNTPVYCVQGHNQYLYIRFLHNGTLYTIWTDTMSANDFINIIATEYLN